ncbi:hypothetical protein P692DRAFT_20756503 [Suillus brevipes Sb2]|nr:hypothetical protein P692DRAFT_20756503 [Suillus brevipes Sb2]
MSQASGTDGAKDQHTHTHNDEQPPPQNDTIEPIEVEKVNDEPSAELPSRISNAEPSQPGPHIQESTSNFAPVGDLDPEAEKVTPEKDQSTLSEL